ncbi:hypothetical protein [Mycobacterium malmoense]|uniref:hypothetical protein n=1 Tax=Mycobacterium malmoense TaxID=1780 RepID=UPI0008F8D181|nr:hypothetical protein [Mycobacterium malmoense]OIN81649.1 hypothetical protein BMG05_06515 [Mycobacterium malmoense]
MPRDDITTLIADNLGSMPHPDGRPRRFMHHSQFAGGQSDPKVQAAVHQLAVDHAVSLQHILETHGYTLTHKDDPKTADAEGYKTGHIKCLRCGKQLLTIGFDTTMTTTMNRTALLSLTQINPECPHEATR